MVASCIRPEFTTILPITLNQTERFFLVSHLLLV